MAAKAKKQTSVNDLIGDGPDDGEILEENLIETGAQEETAGTNAAMVDSEIYEDDEYEGEDDNDSIPTLIIVQKTHDDLIAAGHAGKLYCPEMDMAFDKMNVTLLLRYSTRVMWPEDYNSDNDPLCRSKDSISPAGDIQDAEGNVIPACGESCDWDKATLGKKGVWPKHICSYANWGGTKDKPTPPPCKEVVNLILLNTELEIPFLFSLSSTGLAPFKTELTKPMGYRKMSLTAKRRKLGLGKAMNFMFTFDLEINPKDRESTKGKSKLPLFSNIQDIVDVVDGPEGREGAVITSASEIIETNFNWKEGLKGYVEMMRNAAPEQGGDGGDGENTDDESDEDVFK